MTTTITCRWGAGRSLLRKGVGRAGSRKEQGMALSGCCACRAACGSPGACFMMLCPAGFHAACSGPLDTVRQRTTAPHPLAAASVSAPRSCHPALPLASPPPPPRLPPPSRTSLTTRAGAAPTARCRRSARGLRGSTTWCARRPGTARSRPPWCSWATRRPPSSAASGWLGGGPGTGAAGLHAGAGCAPAAALPPRVSWTARCRIRAASWVPMLGARYPPVA